MNADLYRNERPDGVFFFCKQKEKTPMKNNATRTIRSEEITIDRAYLRCAGGKPGR